MRVKEHFQVGGTLNPSCKSYVVRQADKQIVLSIQKGEFCFVLNSRQMGKSSLMVKTAELLSRDSIRSAFSDLSNIGSHNITSEQWYKAFAYDILESLDLDTEVDLDEWWEKYSSLASASILDRFFKDVLLTNISEKIHIFVDEIDSIIRLPFKDDFFALIRGFYNKRSVDKDYKRLTFCLVGVATPSDLINDKTRTPFNIGTPIELTGFTFEKAKNALLTGLEEAKNALYTEFSEMVKQPETVLEEILYWTGGQPFLTQKLCQLVVDNYGINSFSIEKIVQQYMVDNWEAQDNPQHFRTIKDRLLSQESKVVRLLGTYQKVLDGEKTGKKVTVERSEIIDILRLSGIVVNKDNYLEVYNPIYKQIFNQDWVQQQLDELRPYSQQINQWLANDKDSNYLLEGAELERAKEWANPNKRSISDRDREYLDASVREQNRIENSILQQRNSILHNAKEEAEKRLQNAKEEADEKIKKGQKRLTIATILSVIAIVVVIVSGLYARKQLKESNISKLENQGNKITAEFQRNQISGLISAIETSDKLGDITNNKSQSLANYPTYSPIQSFFDIVDDINQQNILQGHNEEIKKVVFSPDGRVFASADEGKIIKLWDAQTHQELETLAEHEQEIRDLGFSPDGRYLLSIDLRGNFKRWDITSSDSKLQAMTLEATTSDPKLSILAANFSSDGQTVAVSFSDGKISIWNLNDITGEPVVEKDYLSDYRASVYAMDYDRNGQNLVLGDSEGNINIWNLPNNSTITKSKAHKELIQDIIYSPDGKKIASSSADGTIKLWDSTGKLLNTYLAQAREQANLAFSPDSKILVTGGQNGTIELWNTSDRQSISVKSFIHSQDEAVNSFSFSPDGNILVTGGSDRTIQLWQLNNNLIPQIKAHDRPVNSLSISQNNNLLVSGGDDGQIVFWQPTANTQATEGNLSHKTYQSSLVNSNQYELIKGIKCDRSIVNSISINPTDSNFIACGGVKGIKVYNRQDKSFREVVTGDQGEIDTLSYSPDGQTIIAGTSSGKLTLWNLDGTVKQEFVTDNSQNSSQLSNITSVRFSSDGQTIAVSRGNLVQIWNLDGKLTNTFTGHQDNVSSLSFNSNGNLLVSGDKRGTVKLWDSRANEIKSFSPAGNSAITEVAFSPDDKMIVAADALGKINFWKRDRADEVNFMFAIEENSRVNSIRFVNDGQTIIAGKTDGSIALWDLNLDKLIAKGCLWLEDYFTAYPDAKLDACRYYFSFHGDNY